MVPSRGTQTWHHDTLRKSAKHASIYDHISFSGASQGALQESAMLIHVQVLQSQRSNDQVNTLHMRHRHLPKIRLPPSSELDNVEVDWHCACILKVGIWKLMKAVISQEESQDEAGTRGQRKKWQERQGGQSSPGAWNSTEVVEPSITRNYC